jgi:lysophospholipase L1-like esterase
MIEPKSLKFWTPEGFEISSYKWGISNRKNSSYKTSGSDNTGKCVYTYNELGFRGDSIYKEGFKILSIGDSNTEGVGVKDTETWPFQVSRYIPNSVNLNMGTGGRSNDFISRCLLTFYDLLKPDLVLIMYTLPQRREFYTQNGGVEPFMPTDSWGYLKETDEGKFIQDRLTLIQNDNEDIINWYKNHNLIKYFLESKKCNWIWNGWMNIPKASQEFNRFDGNYNSFSDFGSDGVHPGPNHNRRYAKNLINHISQKFSNYIPSILNEEDLKINYKKII